MMKRLLILFATYLLFAHSCILAQVDVKMRLDRADILIGEQVHLETTVKAPAKSVVVFPEFKNGYLKENIEVLECGKIDTLDEGEAKCYTRSYTITSFDSSLYFLPQITFEVDGKEYSTNDDIGLKVSTVPVDTLTLDEPRPLKGPINAVFEWNWWLFSLCMLIMVCLCTTIYLFRRLTRWEPLKKRVVIMPPTPPHKVAIKEIEKIRPSENGSEEEQKLYYVQLTDILRTYIEARFGINAREMTSHEIIRSLISVCDDEAFDEMRRLFTTADLVKFAKFKSSLDEDGQNLVKAAEFVNHTKVENPEAERPIVQEMPLSDKRQLWLKRGFQLLLVTSVLSTFAFAGWLAFELYMNFL